MGKEEEDIVNSSVHEIKLFYEGGLDEPASTFNVQGKGAAGNGRSDLWAYDRVRGKGRHREVRNDGEAGCDRELRPCSVHGKEPHGGSRHGDTDKESTGNEKKRRPGVEIRIHTLEDTPRTTEETVTTWGRRTRARQRSPTRCCN